MGLSADQQTKVRAIYLAQANEATAARSQAPAGGANRDAMRQKMEEGRARLDAQFKDVLTAEQYAKYEQNRNTGKAKVHAGKMKSKAS